jgi:serine/threonine protein kinase
MPKNAKQNNIQEETRSMGEYTLVKKIAQGGMAEIFKGHFFDSSGEKRVVVIKKILPHISANPDFAEMLKTEAKTAVLLSHGNIAQIYDLGSVNDDYFIVMEYVHGRSLSQIHRASLREGHLIPIDLVLFMIAETAKGLQYMHGKTDEQGHPLHIVHRDISPQNIIASYSGTVKIIDFGIAKSKSKIDTTEVGVLKGKFAYMSPEQARGEQIDHKSDIFSLGVILHELLTGKRLFKQKEKKETIRKVRLCNVPPPSSIRSDIPLGADEIIGKACAKDPRERYHDAGLFYNDLTKLLSQVYPQFKPVDLEEYLHDLFKDIDDESVEEEHSETPFLIIPKNTSIVYPHDDAPHESYVQAVMKEFMLEEQEEEKDPDKPDKEEVKNQDEEDMSDDVEELSEESESEEIDEVVQEELRSERRFTAFTFVLILILLGVLGMAGYSYYSSIQLNKTASLSPHASQEIIEKQNITLTLEVSSEPPGASIFVDNQDTGKTTPATISGVPFDKKAHTIGLFLKNHAYEEIPFKALAGGSKTYHATLTVNYADVTITSEPSGAHVYFDDTLVGKTPLTFDRLHPEKSVTMRVSKDGFTKASQILNILPGRHYELFFELERVKE